MIEFWRNPRSFETSVHCGSGKDPRKPPILTHTITRGGTNGDLNGVPRAEINAKTNPRHRKRRNVTVMSVTINCDLAESCYHDHIKSSRHSQPPTQVANNEQPWYLLPYMYLHIIVVECLPQFIFAIFFPRFITPSHPQAIRHFRLGLPEFHANPSISLPSLR